LIRVSMFVTYLALISLLPDLRRVFQYHAAEHKAINAYEAGEPLEPEVAQRYSLIHPRCGTAFLLWVMVLAVFVFAFFGRPAWYWLIATRILLLPVIAGLAYELIRFAGKHQQNKVLMTLLAPGSVAAAADDARADARPARGLDPGPARGARPRGCGHAQRAARRGHGLAPSEHLRRSTEVRLYVASAASERRERHGNGPPGRRAVAGELDGRLRDNRLNDDRRDRGASGQLGGALD